MIIQCSKGQGKDADDGDDDDDAMVEVVMEEEEGKKMFTVAFLKIKFYLFGYLCCLCFYFWRVL